MVFDIEPLICTPPKPVNVSVTLTFKPITLETVISSSADYSIWASFCSNPFSGLGDIEFTRFSFP